MDRSFGFYRSYNAGKFNGQGEDQIMFCFYSSDKTPGQCRLVPQSDANAEIAAIERNGYYRRMD